MGSMLPYIAAPWILWATSKTSNSQCFSHRCRRHRRCRPARRRPRGQRRRAGGHGGSEAAAVRNDARAANRGETGRWNHGVGGETGRETWDLPGRKWMTYGEMDVGVGILSMSKLWGWAWWLMLELAVSGSCWRRKSWWFKECRMWWLNVIETCLQVLQTQSSSILHFPSWKQG